MSETVPYEYPFGGITGEDWVCARCRENVTGCELCAGQPVYVIYSPAPTEADGE